MSGRPIFSESNLHRKSFLLFSFFSFLFPLLNACVDTAEGEEFFFVVNHFLAARAGERVVLHQEDCFLRADFLAEAAENAAKHVDLEFLRHLLRVWAVSELPDRARWNNFNGLWRTDEFAK